MCPLLLFLQYCVIVINDYEIFKYLYVEKEKEQSIFAEKGRR